METALLKKNNGTYSPVKMKGDEAWIIADFLISDVGAFAFYYKEWALGQELVTGGNATFLKKENACVIMTHDFIATEVEVKIPVASFVSMLDECVAISQKKYATIELQWDGKEIEFRMANI